MMNRKIYINRNTKICPEGGEMQWGTPVMYALNGLKRDIQKVCADARPAGQICLECAELPPEGWRILVKNGALCIQAGDDLGMVYGIYALSRELLGVQDLWFWNDQEFMQTQNIEVPEDYEKHSQPARVRYRGWFINDEVLLANWSVERDPDKPWQMAFEALLRCGGNLVIPGTDKNARRYRRLASDMGLIITHHHAEPLGAEMFARAYPDLQASYREYPRLFEELWKQGIAEQKGMHVLWNLGFRGQGDRPFWEDDSRYDTPESRGALMSGLIKKQYDLVREADPQAVCCTNLYGETMELYRQGFLQMPEDVIRIWADNGFGKMVSRRQGNHNPRVSSMPDAEAPGKNGIYYHVSFYDLQAGNHVTMLPNGPDFVRRELEEVLECHGDDYWIINCSNIKPHVYYLDLIANLWRSGTVDVKAHRESYVEAYYGPGAKAVADCLEQYPSYALAYGKREDEHAGEQFSNHCARILISQYMRSQAGDAPADELLWAADAKTLREQNRWFLERCREAAAGYSEYEARCEETALSLPDHILLQVKLLLYCYRGTVHVGKSLDHAFEENYQQAFYEAGLAREDYLRADRCMRDREHGKWKDFYANECLTDIKQTAWLLEGLMFHVRNLGDGPHFYRWQREFLYREQDAKVMLILNMENHLNNEELFALMKERWER
jgi:hypothetical protein